MEPSETYPDIVSPPDRQAPDAVVELAVNVRGALTTILGPSQLLQRHIRNGQVTDVGACMQTLGQIDTAVRALNERMNRLEGERS